VVLLIVVLFNVVVLILVGDVMICDVVGMYIYDNMLFGIMFMGV